MEIVCQSQSILSLHSIEENGSLDLEKLGLRDADEEESGGIANAVQRVVHLVSRRDNKVEDSDSIGE